MLCILYNLVLIATGNIGIMAPYSYHGNTIFKRVLSPQQYLLLILMLFCTRSPIINIPVKHIDADICGKLRI